MPIFEDETSTLATPTTAEGIEEVPFRAVLRGGIEAASSSVVDALYEIQYEKSIMLVLSRRVNRPSLLAGNVRRRVSRLGALVAGCDPLETPTPD